MPFGADPRIVFSVILSGQFHRLLGVSHPHRSHRLM